MPKFDTKGFKSQYKELTVELIEWFQQKDVPPPVAATVMINVIGVLVGLRGMEKDKQEFFIQNISRLIKMRIEEIEEAGLD